MSAVYSSSAPVALRADAQGAPVRSPLDSAGPPNGDGFAALLQAYRYSGGTARGDDLSQLFEDHLRGDYVSLAKLLAAREVFGFKWRQTLWIPMFQFDADDLAVKFGGRRVLCELGSAFGGWSLAVWFAEPNPWLQGRRPVDLLTHDLSEVLSAARRERLGLGRH